MCSVIRNMGLDEAFYKKLVVGVNKIHFKIKKYISRDASAGSDFALKFESTVENALVAILVEKIHYT